MPSAGSRIARAREAIAVELVLSRGFPLSAAHLATAAKRICGAHGPADDPVPPGFRDSLDALRAMESANQIVRVHWPGRDHDGLTYWVLPTSPWAD